MCTHAAKTAITVILVLLLTLMMLGNRRVRNQSFLQEFASTAATISVNATRASEYNSPTLLLESNKTASSSMLTQNATTALESESPSVEVKASAADLLNKTVPTTAPTIESKEEQLEKLVTVQNATNTSNAVTAPLLIGAAKPLTKREQNAAVAHFNHITQAWSNGTSVSYFQARFYAGYRNQIMAFTALVMESVRRNHSQILLVGLKHKDTFGTNKNIEHEKLFDVEHWNSHYPQLPRLVRCDPVLHEQLKCTGFRPRWQIENPEANATRPYAMGRQGRLLSSYKRYSEGRGPMAIPTFRNPVELVMLRGAMRPHPDLRAIADQLIASLGAGDKEYMTLHARVEPDMQAHNVCWEKKEKNLTKIFIDLEKQFPEPPAPMVFMPINRQYMEQEGSGPNKEDPSKTNWLAIENLSALNHAISHGLWNGTVNVFEFGAKALRGTPYGARWSTSGAILNFYIALGGSVFVGTEVSSYSIDLVSTRFYRGNRKNYKYLPDGFHEWTPEGMKDAPPFLC